MPFSRHGRPSLPPQHLPIATHTVLLKPDMSFLASALLSASNSNALLKTRPSSLPPSSTLKTRPSQDTAVVPPQHLPIATHTVQLLKHMSFLAIVPQRTHCSAFQPQTPMPFSRHGRRPSSTLAHSNTHCSVALWPPLYFQPQTPMPFSRPDMFSCFTQTRH